ncbi:apolipoprotein D-like [Uloborus diversus]|uniref:apolipoprotein D-like n=1 Tax=Uloborus diversus TaxID=327109 RepID=UPI002409F296|nr:apolipoprotein D-like [Uloborus diversus]
MRFTVLLLAAFVGLAYGQKINVGGCPDVSVKEPFDLTKYVGVWYEIEKNPTTFEAGLKCNKANYTAQGDYVSVVNSGVNERTGKPSTIEGKATIPDKNVPAKLKVKFPGAPVKADYWILDTDYERYSVVYSCFSVLNLFNAEYLWILSRTPTLDESVKNNLYELLDKYKINRSRLTETKQDC